MGGARWRRGQFFAEKVRVRGWFSIEEDCSDWAGTTASEKACERRSLSVEEDSGLAWVELRGRLQ
jgi:hypothetical protein